MTGALALGPQPTLAAAPKGDSAGRQRRGERLAIHVSQHEHRAAAGVLHDGRQQAVALVPVECFPGVRFLCRQGRTSMLAPRSRRFKCGNRDFAGMEHAGRERRIHVGRLENLGKMLLRAGAAGGDQRHAAHGAHRAQLRDVEAAAHAVARHAIEHDLARAAPLRLDHPIDGVARRVARAPGVAGELLHAIACAKGLAVHPHHHALRAEPLAQLIDQVGTLERGRIDGDFFRAGRQYLLGLRHRADAAGHAERNIERARHARHPGAIHRALLGTR